MNQTELSLKKLLERTSDENLTGKYCDRSQFQELNEKVNNVIPDWLIKLFTDFPIVGLVLEVPDLEDPEYTHDLMFGSAEGIKQEFFDLYPGCFVAELGYICIAEDAGGSGDPFFINVREGENPPVYQIYHDVSDDPKVIVSDGRQKIAESLSELFDRATI